MKRCFFLVFFVLSLSFQSQAQVFIDPESDISQFDWSAFSDSENIQNHINKKENTSRLFGFGYVISRDLHRGKLDLMSLAKELYKERTKEKLTPEEIIQAQNTIQFHLNTIKEMEAQMMISDGFFLQSEVSIFKFPDLIYSWTLRNYKDEYDIIFDFVEKTDEDFYEALGRDDEAYAEFILPYVRDYIERGEIIADTLTNVLELAYENPEIFKVTYAIHLNWMALKSYDLYNSFLKNFKNPKGENQKILMNTIISWYEDQSLKGAKALIGEYELLNTYPSLTGLPHYTVSVLVDYAHKDTTKDVRKELEVFFRKALTDDRLEAGSFAQKAIYLDSLIGLKNLGLLNAREKEAFKRAEKLGGIRTSIETPDVYRSLPTVDL